MPSPSRWEVESIDHVQIIQTLVIFGAPRKQINVVSMLQKNGDIVMRIAKERNEENKNDDGQQLRFIELRQIFYKIFYLPKIDMNIRRTISLIV